MLRAVDMELVAVELREDLRFHVSCSARVPLTGAGSAAGWGAGEACRPGGAIAGLSNSGAAIACVFVLGKSALELATAATGAEAVRGVAAFGKEPANCILLP